MPALESMQMLTQEIIETHRERVGSTRALKTSGGAMLTELHNSHRAMSKNMHDSLARGEAARKPVVVGMLKGFDRTHEAMSKGLRAGLSQDAADRRTAIETMLLSLDEAHQAMAKTLQADLAQTQRRRKATLKTMLSGFDGAHRAMSKGLRASLARSGADCRAVVAAELKEFRKEQAQTRKEQAAVHIAWQRMMTTLQSGNGGATAQTIMPPSPVEVTPAAAAPARPVQETVEETAEFVALRNRVFKYLANRPDGARLVEMESEMGASRFQMSRALRSLMDENKVEKRDLLYFAI
ncbi:MAG: hypothetical protein Q8P59_09000 [Dehalococcoidia bacterium]|nr:hypothetical protein [Dehalococcoidia bacterium]